MAVLSEGLVAAIAGFVAWRIWSRPTEGRRSPEDIGAAAIFAIVAVMSLGFAVSRVL